MKIKFMFILGISLFLEYSLIGVQDSFASVGMRECWPYHGGDARPQPPKASILEASLDYINPGYALSLRMSDQKDIITLSLNSELAVDEHRSYSDPLEIAIDGKFKISINGRSNSCSYTGVAQISPQASRILFPANSADAKSEDCQNAISNSIRRIEAAKSTIVKFEQHKQRYQDYPINRSLGYDVWISGKGAINVMSSGIFLRAISTQIISHCKSIGSVTFGQYRTDWVAIFGLMENGKVEPFECLVPRPGVERDLTWGKQICL